MNWIGVITGDIVNSTEILNAGQREKLLEVMHRTVEEMNQDDYCSNIRMEIYRGDSFQIIVEKAYDAMDVAIAIRAAIIANSSTDMRWDARIGIGIGKGEFITDKVTESDGEAFHLSGKAFDSLERNSRMAILTPNEDFNQELMVSSAFADDIISNWTPIQAKTFFLSLTKQLNQKEIAKIENKSPQAISKIYIAGKIGLISQFIVRFCTKSLQYPKSC